jgi:hypothetical protein
MAEKDNTIYCGNESKLPKGKRFGTMKECVEKGQIRRFGLFKIPVKTIEGAKKLDDPQTKEKLLMELIRYRGLYRANKNALEKMKAYQGYDPIKRKDEAIRLNEYETIMLQAEKKIGELSKKIQKIDSMTTKVESKPKKKKAKKESLSDTEDDFLRKQALSITDDLKKLNADVSKVNKLDKTNKLKRYIFDKEMIKKLKKHYKL